MARRLVQARDVEALAGHLAAFHRSLVPLTAEAPGGLPPKDARQWALESLDEITAHPLRPRDCSLDELAAVRRAIDETFTQAQALVDQRRAQGFVRECHGDLHLGNLVRWQGEVFAFDAIEFDARLRCIDVVSDVAFTFMDLHAVGLRPLAWRFINAWAGHTGDFGGLVLLHRYAAYRALVRAKVVLLSGGDAAAFMAFWRLASELVRGPQRPRLVITVGLSGSGKSTVACALADALGAIWLRSDVERKRLHGLQPHERPQAGSALYGVDAAAHLCAPGRRRNLQARARGGRCRLLRRDERQAMRAAPQRWAFRSCAPPRPRSCRRILQRLQTGNDPSDATLDVLALQQRVQEPLTPDEQGRAVEVANDGPLEALADPVRRLVAAWSLQESSPA
jgi:hypothetical protein